MQALVRVLNWQEPGRLAAAGPNRAPESLSLYVDERMKGEFKDMEAARLEASLDDVIALFRCLSAKDVFEEHYKNATARRLLSGRMPSEDVERLMISKLKAECGAAFTSKLEGMFMDLSKSAIFMEQYHTARGSSGSSGGAAVHDRRHMADFDATVLTSSNWAGSIQAGPVAQLPPPVSAALADFEAYYGERFNGRRLTWCYNKGTAEMRAWIGATSRPYELLVSTYQMIILYSFNSATEVSYKYVRARTGTRACGHARVHG
ncbi:hypothetical protein EON66_03735 [archaeon]|nr:MAG: hypothetical protein EON66_03735 [archaeon]